MREYLHTLLNDKKMLKVSEPELTIDNFETSVDREFVRPWKRSFLRPWCQNF